MNWLRHMFHIISWQVDGLLKGTRLLRPDCLPCYTEIMDIRLEGIDDSQ